MLESDCSTEKARAKVYENGGPEIVMNVLTQAIRQLCRNHLLNEKWLLAPSLRAGHEWFFAVAQSGQPVVNGHVKTLMKLALDLAGPAISERNLEFVSARRCALLVDRIIGRLRRRKPQEGYLWRMSPSVQLAEVVHKAIEAVRRAGLHAGDLVPERFEVDLKGQELQQILIEYERDLHNRRWIDRADVLELAIERLTKDARALGRDVLVLVPEDIDADVSGLERRLLDALPVGRALTCPWISRGNHPR
jgi:hypothetical protein